MTTLHAARHELGNDALVIASDAADLAAQKSLAATVKEAFGELDILFVNAGIVEMRPIEKWDEAAFDRSMGINFKGPFFLIQALLPVFASPASIVLNASVNAHIGMPNTSIYGASKAALLSLARTVSGELAGRRIRVNAISPGPIDYTFVQQTGPAGSPAQSRLRLHSKPGSRRALWNSLRNRQGGGLLRLRRIGIHAGQRTADRWRHE